MLTAVPKVSWKFCLKEAQKQPWPSPTSSPHCLTEEIPKVHRTCRHQPYPVQLISVEQWQLLHRLVCVFTILILLLLCALLSWCSWWQLWVSAHCCLSCNFALCNFYQEHFTAITSVPIQMTATHLIFFSTDDVISRDVALDLPTIVVEGSARASFSVVGKYIINKT